MRNVKKIAAAAVIAAVYAVLTVALAPISYANIQLRLSEALCLLPYSFPFTSFGISVGCFLANLLNPAGINIFDVIFGTAATAVAAVWTSKLKRRAMAPLPMTISNGIIVGAVLTATAGTQSFWATFAVFALEIAAGELIVGYCVGLPLLLLFEKHKTSLGVADLQRKW